MQDTNGVWYLTFGVILGIKVGDVVNDRVQQMGLANDLTRVRRVAHMHHVHV